MDNSNKGFQTLTGLSYFILNSQMGLLWRGDMAYLQIPSDYQPIDIYFTPGTAGWNETCQKERAGLIWTQKLEVICPPEILSDFTEQKSLTSYPLMLLLTFTGGQKLLGRPGHGCRMGIEFADSKGLQVNLSVEHKDMRRAPYVYGINYV